MNAPLYLIIVLTALLGRYLLDLLADALNAAHVHPDVPAEFRDVLDPETYRRSQAYLRDTTRLDRISDTVATAASVALILAGGFDRVDRAARALGWPEVPTSLVFIGAVTLIFGALALPFSAYRTWVIEERYGFNRTTVRTFILDILKSMLLGAALGGPLCALVLALFETAGPSAWVLCWLVVAAFQGLILLVAPYVILPLFNRFTPLPPGEQRNAIENYARRMSFNLRGVFKMDGSKRSSKANAFFTGFGASRRIVLFDTLIDQYTTPEMVAIVAHEMGHYRRKHIPRTLLRTVAEAGVAFWVLSLMLENADLFRAFGMQTVSVYASLVFFGFLYTPISMATAIIEGALSRRQEYEADADAVRTCGNPEALVSGLKKLHVDSLSNLTPHPLKVFLSYSHPPVLKRMDRIRRLADTMISR